MSKIIWFSLVWIVLGLFGFGTLHLINDLSLDWKQCVYLTQFEHGDFYAKTLQTATNSLFGMLIALWLLFGGIGFAKIGYSIYKENAK
jgi:hypothetical protein